MNPKRRKLLFTAIFIVIGASAAAALALKAFQENLQSRVGLGRCGEHSDYSLFGVLVAQPASKLDPFGIPQTDHRRLDAAAAAFDAVRIYFLRRGTDHQRQSK